MKRRKNNIEAIKKFITLNVYNLIKEEEENYNIKIVIIFIN